TYAPLFLALGALPAVFLAVSQTPVSLWVLDSLTGLLALAAASVAGMRLALDAPRGKVRGLWQAALGLFLFVALAEFGGPWTEGLEPRLRIEAVSDWIVPVAALVTLWLAIRLDRIPLWPRRALWTGFVLHLVATGFDTLEGLYGLDDAKVGPI